MTEFYPEGRLIETAGNIAALRSKMNIAEACAENRILEARAIICDSEHNLIVDMGCMKGIIPREEGAIGIREGTVKDIAVISRVNRPVCFVVEKIENDAMGNPCALLSRRKAQEKCVSAKISKLRNGDITSGKVTHLESFGAFVDIGCGIIALLPIDSISVSRIEHPGERFNVGMDIRVIVKNIENGRISLSHKELLGTWSENVKDFKAGETVAGIIRSVEDYGAFVELTPNLAGLAELKENIKTGQQASVYIKSIIPERMKIKLIIIDAFDYKIRPEKPKYYFNGDHLDSFLYSPTDCKRCIETVFA
ncbi:MAG: S1 RNA-binding domain-containing protein [Acutalibacteraceae bacterium]